MVAVAEVPDLLTVEEVARVLRIGRTTAYQEVNRFTATGGAEGIPVIVVGGQKRIPRARLEALFGGPVHLPPPTARTADAPADSLTCTTARRRCRLDAPSASPPLPPPSYRSTSVDRTMADDPILLLTMAQFTDALALGVPGLSRRLVKRVVRRC